MRGLFITLEGPEGSGKSTQADLLVRKLTALGLEVVKTREPGGTPTGEAIRDILQHDRAGEPIVDQTETLLFAASRAQLVNNVIVPALQRGACVVSDRFVDSTTAYQGYGRGFDIDEILAINTFAINGALPDLTVLLDIDIGVGFERLDVRNRRTGADRDRIENEEIAFHERVRQGYLALAERWPERVVVVDGSQAEADVEAAVWSLVRERLPESTLSLADSAGE